MRILFVGGTSFVGRHTAADAIARGHDVTLFHRGKTGADLFPEAEHVLGDRTTDLERLSGRSFDAVVDVCAYRPSEVRSLVAAIGDAFDRYVYVSTCSVYRLTGADGVTEVGDVHHIDRGYPDFVTDLAKLGVEVERADVPEPTFDF